MDIKKVWAVYFSATGTTQKMVERIAGGIAEKLGTEYETYDFTLPGARETPLHFEKNDFVVFGTPVYAGRVPNILLKYLDTVEGNGAVAVPVVLYGNRNYDDSLIELRDILEKQGFHAVAAAAFVGEHSFSYVLAEGRPDEKDMLEADSFAEKVAAKTETLTGADSFRPVDVKGIPKPYRGYYQPRDRGGNPVDIRKVKPLTSDDCNNCMICAAVCPMGSISHENVRDVAGICIKCGACVKKCPLHAKYYEDEPFLYHKRELEEGLPGRAVTETFF